MSTLREPKFILPLSATGHHDLNDDSALSHLELRGRRSRFSGQLINNNSPYKDEKEGEEAKHCLLKDDRQIKDEDNAFGEPKSGFNFNLGHHGEEAPINDAISSLNEMSNSLRVKEAGNRSNKDNLMSNVDSLILNHQQHYHHLKQRAKLRSNNRTTMDTQSQLNNNNSITSNPLLTGQQFNILASQQQQQQTSISASSSPMPLATKATKPNSIGSNQTKLTSMNHTKKSLTADQQQQQQMHVCRLCDKLLSSSSSLDRHMLTHSGERPFVCKRCHMTFTTNGNMHRHMRTHLHKDSLARQQQEQQLKSLVAAGANTVVGASAPATPKSITATATVANTTSTKAPHSIDCRHAGAVFRNSNQIQNNNSLHPHLNNHHQHLANSIFNNQLPCDTASVAAAAAAALCNQQQQAATSVNNSTQSSSAVVSELINQHLVAALKQSPFLYDNQHHNTQHQHHQQLQQSVSNLVSAANPLELHNNSQHLKEPQLGLATIMDQQHLSNKALMIQLAAAAAAAAASSGAGPDHHQQQLGLESVKAVMFAAAAAATAAVNQRQQLQQQQQQRIPEKLTTEQTFDHQASYLNLARGKRRKQIHPRSTKVQQQQSNQTSLVSGDDDDVYSECNERIEVLSRFDANLEDDAGQEKPFSARIVDQKQPNFELAAPEGMKSVHHEHLASSSLSNESATSLDEERKEDLNNNNPVNSGEEVTKIESSSRFVVDGSKLQLVCVNNNQVENDNKLDGPKTIGRSYADMIDSNESGDESEQDEDEDLELDEEELLNVNQMNLITSGEDSLGSDVNMIGSNTSSGSDNNNNSSHSNNNTDSSYDDIDIVGGDDPSRQTLQQRPQEQLAAASGNMDFLDDKQPINYLSAIDDSGNLHETTNIELDDQEIEEEDSKEQQSQLHLTSSEPIKSSKLASKNKSTLINDLDDVIEDISQSYVKTANPNATRKGGKRNRHCYRCKLCTYSSVDRCTLVRHLRIHSGERPYICGICRYAFTTKANCERHVRKRHKKQYNSLGGAGGGGIKGSNGGGRSLIITDHSNHQTIPVKVNPVAAQTISQTLQRIQEKQSIDLAAQALDLSCKRTAAAAAQKVSQKSHKIHS